MWWVKLEKDFLCGRDRKGELLKKTRSNTSADFMPHHLLRKGVLLLRGLYLYIDSKKIRTKEEENKGELMVKNKNMVPEPCITVSYNKKVC